MCVYIPACKHSMCSYVCVYSYMYTLNVFLCVHTHTGKRARYRCSVFLYVFLYVHLFLRVYSLYTRMCVHTRIQERARDRRRHTHACARQFRVLHAIECVLSGLECVLSDLECVLSDLECVLSDLECVLSDIECVLSDMECVLSRAGKGARYRCRHTYASRSRASRSRPWARAKLAASVSWPRSTPVLSFFSVSFFLFLFLLRRICLLARLHSGFCFYSNLFLLAMT